MLELLVSEGALCGRRFSLEDGGKYLIGRSSVCQIHLPCQGVSRQHCSLEFRGPELWIVDMDSANGTVVNGSAVKEKCLEPGDSIVLGAAVLVLCGVECNESSCAGQCRKNRGTSVMLVADDMPKGRSVKRKYERDTSVLGPAGSENPELARAMKRLEAIYLMSNTITVETDPLKVLDVAAETVLSVCGADRSAILLVDEPGAEPQAVVVKTGENDGEAEFRVSRTIVDETIGQGVSVMSSDATSDSRFAPGASVVMQNVRSVMCVPLQSEERVVGALYVDSTSHVSMFSEAELAMLAAIGQQAGVAMERAGLVEELEKLFVGSMHTIIATLEAKDAYTRGHSERVTAYALMIADEMDLERRERGVLELAALFHDVGKIGVPEAVLQKPSALTAEEFDEIKKHPQKGAKIIEHMPQIDRMVHMPKIIEAVRHHHERYDGGGYPGGLKGEEIPFLSRILSVADTYDAITSRRPYRDRRDEEEAIKIIRECSGTQLDSTVASAFEKVFTRGDTERPGDVATRFRSFGD